MSTLKLETYVPKAGVNKPKSKFGLAWDRLTKPAEEPPYRPLADNFIRVAKIKPGTKDRPLRIKLKHIDLRLTKYIALSYTWDQDPLPAHSLDRYSSSESQYTLPRPADPEKPKTTTLLCGGTNFRVRQNLYDALCQIRDVQSDVPVFVDALCINFNDNAERSRHVEMMGQIYARAASTIVYLGPKSPGADSTILVMRQLVNAIDWRRIGDPADGGPGAYNFRDPHFFQSIGMEPLTLKQWRAIRDFCQMRWFTRYWAFFELALSKNALFLWGEGCMEDKFLTDFCMILNLSGWLDELRQMGSDNLLSSTFRADENVVPLIKMLVPVAQLRSSPPWSPKNNNFARWMYDNHGIQSERGQAWQFFETLLKVAEPFDCLNPLDRMYAPLALARAFYAGKHVDNIWPTPDYQKTVADVYGDFAQQVLQETGNYSIIAGMEGYTGPVPQPQPRIENATRHQYRDASQDRDHSRGRDRDRSRHESTPVNKTMPIVISNNRPRPESTSNTRPTSSRGGTEMAVLDGGDPRFRTVNGTRFKNNFNQSSTSVPDRDMMATEPLPKSRNGKLVTKRAPSRNA